MATSIAYTATQGTVLLGDELKSRYQGDLTSDNVRHGVGSYQYPNRFFRYEGEYVNGKKHGRGKLTMASGDTYEGEFQNDEICGKGLRTYANGSRYAGMFVDGEAQGQGRLQSCQGWTYIGEFRCNRFHGQGRKEWVNGDCYIGSFQDHLFHGEGELSRSSGYHYKGAWTRGKPHGEGVQVSDVGDRYQGTFEDGQYDGAGTLTLAGPGTEYREATFRRGQVSPLPARMLLEYPKVVDKKKGELPPELPIGEQVPDTFCVQITVQAHQGRQEADDAASLAEAAPEAAGCADAYSTCDFEHRRPIVITLHRGEATVNDDGGRVLGERVEVPAMRTWVDLTTNLGTEEGDQQAGTADETDVINREQAEQQQGADQMEPGCLDSSECMVRAMAGVAEWRQFQLGVLDDAGVCNLEPGAYTVVFSSHDLPDAYMSINLSLPRKKK